MFSEELLNATLAAKCITPLIDVVACLLDSSPEIVIITSSIYLA